MGSRPVPDTNVPRSAGTRIPQSDQNAQQYDNRSWPRQDDIATGGILPPLSSSYDQDDYSLDPASSIRPLDSTFEDEQPDLLAEDYRHTQGFWEAAQTKDASAAIPSTEPSAPPQGTPEIIDLSSTPDEVDDPLSNMVDDHTPSLPEQRGSVVYHEPDEEVHDIADEPTDVLHIEDLGDIDDEFYRGSSALTLEGSEESLEEEQDIPGPSRVHGVRPRTGRTGSMRPSQPLQPDLDDKDVLLPPPSPPVYDQKARLSPYGEATGQVERPPSYPVMGAAYRQPPVRGTQSPPVQAKPQSNVAPAAKAPPRAAPKPTATQAKKPAQKSNANLGLGAAALVSVLVILLTGLLAYFGPSADVTITLQSHSYPLQLELAATATSQFNALQHTVPAQTLLHDASASGTGHATGTATVGTVQATGAAQFTNNGTSPVVIPNGTIVSTKNNILFATQAEVLVLSGSSNTNLAPVQAQIAGTGGNVATGSINTITREGLAKIQTANPSLSPTDIKISVTNPAATTGGGAGTAATVTNQDVTALKQQLDLQLQANVNAFIAKNVHVGDQQGKIVQVESPPAVIPPVGSIVATGTFLMTIKLHLSVLVVRAATIQAASIAEMNAAISKQNPGYALVPQQKVAVTKMVNKPSSNGTSMTLNFTAIGQIAPQIPEDIVRQLVSGKSPADAKYVLTNPNSGGLPPSEVVFTQINIFPGFIGWVTFYTPHISVHYKYVPQPPKKK